MVFKEDQEIPSNLRVRRGVGWKPSPSTISAGKEKASMKGKGKAKMLSDGSDTSDYSYNEDSEGMSYDDDFEYDAAVKLSSHSSKKTPVQNRVAQQAGRTNRVHCQSVDGRSRGPAMYINRGNYIGDYRSEVDTPKLRFKRRNKRQWAVNVVVTGSDILEGVVTQTSGGGGTESSDAEDLDSYNNVGRSGASNVRRGVNHGRPCGGRPTGVRPKRAKEVSRTGSSDPVERATPHYRRNMHTAIRDLQKLKLRESHIAAIRRTPFSALSMGTSEYHAYGKSNALISKIIKRSVS